MTKRYVTQLSYDIVGLAIKVHKELGPGLLESVYQRCLEYELQTNNYQYSRQQSVPIEYGNMQFDAELRLDLLVSNCIIVELKAVDTLLPIYEAQLLTYMKLMKKPQGLLINFNTDNIVKSMKPFVNAHFSALPD